jgi:hypothetical protein
MHNRDSDGLREREREGAPETTPTSSPNSRNLQENSESPCGNAQQLTIKFFSDAPLSSKFFSKKCSSTIAPAPASQTPLLATDF